MVNAYMLGSFTSATEFVFKASNCVLRTSNALMAALISARLIAGGGDPFVSRPILRSSKILARLHVLYKNTRTSTRKAAPRSVRQNISARRRTWSGSLPSSSVSCTLFHIESKYFMVKCLTWSRRECRHSYARARVYPPKTPVHARYQDESHWKE